MFAALFVTPSITTAGIPTPIGIWVSVTPTPASLTARRTVRTIAGTTTSGADGWGVATRRRGPTSVPLSTSTTATLIPLPPTSTPTARRSAAVALMRRPRSEVVDGDATVDHEVRPV